MKVTIEIFAGPNHEEPTKSDMDRNIQALQRAIIGKPLGNDFMWMVDIKHILVAIQKKLPD